MRGCASWSRMPWVCRRRGKPDRTGLCVMSWCKAVDHPDYGGDAHFDAACAVASRDGASAYTLLANAAECSTELSRNARTSETPAETRRRAVGAPAGSAFDPIVAPECDRIH